MSDQQTTCFAVGIAGIDPVRDNPGNIHLQSLKAEFYRDDEEADAVTESIWSDQVMAIQERERQRIASDLHDGVGQLLTLMLIDLHSAKTAIGKVDVGTSGLQACLERACTGARQAMDELRRSVMELYPSILDDIGLTASLTCLLREVREAQPLLQVEAVVSVCDSQVPAPLQIVAYRILQESVNNVLKHAHATRLKIRFWMDADRLILTIRDDGCGISAADRQGRTGGAGLRGMRRRVMASGGKIDITSEYGKGTDIRVSWSQIKAK
jgi:two-component system NarL family sensor kinase